MSAMRNSSVNGTSAARLLFHGMPRYFFHIYHGDEAVHIDRIGEDLPDRHAAWKEATETAGLSIRDLDGQLKPGTDWRLEVTDEFAKRIYAIHVSGVSEVGDPERR